jgi:hypothetical protein
MRSSECRVLVQNRVSEMMKQYLPELSEGEFYEKCTEITYEDFFVAGNFFRFSGRSDCTASLWETKKAK